MAWVIPPVQGLIDPMGAPTYTIDDIGAIWLENGIADTYYYQRQPCLHGGDPQNVTCVIIRRQGAGLVSSFMKVASFAGYFIGNHPPAPTIRPGNFTPRVVS